MAPAVRIRPLPAMISVDGPITSAGSTPSIVSGLPALPMPTMRPSRTPTSALTMPQWSRIDRAGDDEVGRALGAGRRRLAHRLADHLAAAEHGLVAADAEVLARPRSAGRCRRGGCGRRSSGRTARRSASRGRIASSSRPAAASQRPGDLAAQPGDDPAPAASGTRSTVARRCRARSAPTCRPGRPAGARAPRRGRTHSAGLASAKW